LVWKSRFTPNSWSNVWCNWYFNCSQQWNQSLD
jgi:hypothetical protein